jgi:tRNA/rRNA methyltransferase
MSASTPAILADSVTSSRPALPGNPPDEGAHPRGGPGGDLFPRVRFVLVSPSHPGNVGAAARAIKTMGFSDLVLVTPRLSDVKADPEAQAMASGADDVLAQARVVGSLEEALSGVHWSVALSARPREYGPPLTAPRAAAEQAIAEMAEGANVALVFGNERTGLSNDDVARCSAIAHIPANPVYSSLNLAQAIQVLAYEMRLACLQTVAPGDVAATATATSARASTDDIEGMYAHFEQALIALKFLDPANPKKLMARVRQLFGRSGLEPEEVNILRGIAKHILLQNAQHGKQDPSGRA